MFLWGRISCSTAPSLRKGRTDGRNISVNLYSGAQNTSIVIICTLSSQKSPEGGGGGFLPSPTASHLQEIAVILVCIITIGRMQMCIIMQPKVPPYVSPESGISKIL